MSKRLKWGQTRQQISLQHEADGLVARSYYCAMFARWFKLTKNPQTDFLQIGSRSVPLLFVHHPQARRYLLRLQSDGTARVTIPKRGSISTAREFVSKNVDWLAQQIGRLESRPREWKLGAEIYFRGALTKIEFEDIGKIRLGAEILKVPDLSKDLRPAVEKHLRKLAAQELWVRVSELAALHQIEISKISVRNQRSRWGSCSRAGTISLNWRLIQLPDFVRDYIILHELAHRQHMNHSGRFWGEVERLCPGYLEAEKWIKKFGKAVMG